MASTFSEETACWSVRSCIAVPWDRLRDQSALVEQWLRDSLTNLLKYSTIIWLADFTICFFSQTHFLKNKKLVYCRKKCCNVISAHNRSVGHTDYSICCRSRTSYTGYKQRVTQPQQNNLTSTSYTTAGQQQQLQQQQRLQQLNQTSASVQPTMLQTIQTQPTIGMLLSVSFKGLCYRRYIWYLMEI